MSTSLSYGFYVSSNTTVEIMYRAKETYHLTVNNGTGSGNYKERQTVSITANSGDFSHWTYSNLYSIGDTTSSTTTVKLGRSDGVVTANYNMREITIVINTGTSTYNVIDGNSINIDSGTAPNTYEFDHWVVTSGDATIANAYLSLTRVTAHTQDSTIEALYKPIPNFTVTMQDGYVWDGSNWVTSATLLRNATNAIKMKPAPTGKQFLQWEVYENGVLQTDANDILEPLAEQTTLRNLLRNITIKATYYTPDPTVTYTLSIERKDGTIEQNNYAVGTNIPIYASTPNTGYEFYKWIGDVAYITGGIYYEDSAVLMPARNIQIEETYVPEGYIPKYDITMYNNYGKVCYETEEENPETHEIEIVEHWVSSWSFEEGSIVKIKAEGWGNEYEFNFWKAYERLLDQNGQELPTIIDDTTASQTTLTVPPTNVTVEPNIGLKATKPVIVNGGGTNANYYAGARADIYFGYDNSSNDVHYQFLRWTTGSNSEVQVQDLELYDGGMFSVTTPGTAVAPQYIKMTNPVKTIEVTATYKTLYRLSLTNGTIDTTSTTKEYYESGTTVAISADPAPNGMRFQYWTGDTTRVTNIYDPTTTVTTTTGTTTLTAIYSTDTERNNIGYTTSSLKTSNTVSNSNITMISGSIEVGTIITDSNGHIYSITATNSSESTIYRLTKITQGGNVYG